ncbi:hypothetical protein ACWEV3_40835 [Saccharopolyspora sp. NPDC003752]
MTALIVTFAQPPACPLCDGHRAVEVQPLDGRAPARIVCPLCTTPDPLHCALAPRKDIRA